MFLYIVRHGEPDYATDTLTARGRLQAQAVAKRLADSKIERIFSSPLGRAKETAAPTCRLLGLDCQIEEWAREIETEHLTPYPDGIIKSVSQLQSTDYRENGSIDLGYDRTYECPGFRESQMQSAVSLIEKNGYAFLERLGYKEENGVFRILRPNNERVALFCHGAMGRAWLSVLLHIPLHLMWAGFRYTHTGVTVLEFKNNENGITAPACLCYSDMSHLYAAGPDMVYDGGKNL